jgi:hypothetical protein
MPNDQDEAEAAYAEALKEYLAAQERISEALRGMHRFGYHPAPPEAIRWKLPDEREGKTHKFQIGFGDESVEGYITTGVYCDGKLGEVFIVAEKEGAFVSGILDALATMISIARQHGVPRAKILSKLLHTRYEPAGMTKSKEIGQALSVTDYLAKWLDLRFNDGALTKKETRDGDS